MLGVLRDDRDDGAWPELLSRSLVGTSEDGGGEGVVTVDSASESHSVLRPILRSCWSQTGRSMDF
jgi:hypothetical protein